MTTNDTTVASPPTSPTSVQKHKLDNPWEIPGSFNADEELRINIDMPKDKVNFFRSIRPGKGTMPALCNTLLDKLQQTLEKHGITHFTQLSEFCEFVAKCNIVDGRANAISPLAGSPTPGAVSEARSSNVNGGKKGAPRQNKKREN